MTPAGRRISCAPTLPSASPAWDQRFAGKHADDCHSTVFPARDPLREQMCKACGGEFANAECLGADAFALHQIAGTAELQCPSLPLLDFVTITSCGGPVKSRTHLIRCAECATRFAAACPDKAMAPALATYPDRCRN